MGSVTIDLSAIEEGINRFTFRFGPEEIGLEEEGALFRKPVDLNLEIDRTGQTLTLRGRIRTPVERSCSRCLVPFVDELDTEFTEAMRVEGERARIIDAVDAGEREFPPGPPGSLCLDSIIREAVLVCAPMQPLCRPDCRGLCPVCGADRNKGDCGCEKRSLNPAWEALRKLVNDK